MSHLLSGVHEQSYIADVMAFSACVGEYKLECNRGSLLTASSPGSKSGSQPAVGGQASAILYSISAALVVILTRNL